MTPTARLRTRPHAWASGRRRVLGTNQHRPRSSPSQQAVIALIENLQRADLTPDEICEGIERLHQMTGYDWECTPALALRASAGASVAQMLGKSERTLRRYRRLSALPSAIRAAAA